MKPTESEKEEAQKVAIELVANLAQKYNLEIIHLGCRIAAETIETSTNGKSLDEIIAYMTDFYKHLEKIEIQPVHPTVAADTDKYLAKAKEVLGRFIDNRDDDIAEVRINGKPIRLPAPAKMN